MYRLLRCWAAAQSAPKASLDEPSTAVVLSREALRPVFPLLLALRRRAVPYGCACPRLPEGVGMAVGVRSGPCSWVRAKPSGPFSLAAAGAAGPRRAVRGAVSSAAPARGPDHRRRRRRAARGPSRPGKPYGRDTGRQLPYAAGRRLGRHGGGRAADGRVDGLRAGPRVQAAARARPRRRFRRLSGRHRHGRGVQRPVLRPVGVVHVRAGARALRPRGAAACARHAGSRPRRLRHRPRRRHRRPYPAGGAARPFVGRRRALPAGGPVLRRGRRAVRRLSARAAPRVAPPGKGSSVRAGGRGRPCVRGYRAGMRLAGVPGHGHGPSARGACGKRRSGRLRREGGAHRARARLRLQGRRDHAHVLHRSAAYAGSYDVGVFGRGAASELARVRRRARRDEPSLEEDR